VQCPTSRLVIGHSTLDICLSYGEGGIRTPDRGISPYNGLANRRLQPLGHLSNNTRCNEFCHVPGPRLGRLPTDLPTSRGPRALRMQASRTAYAPPRGGTVVLPL